MIEIIFAAALIVVVGGSCVAVLVATGYAIFGALLCAVLCVIIGALLCAEFDIF